MTGRTSGDMSLSIQQGAGSVKEALFGERVYLALLRLL